MATAKTTSKPESVIPEPSASFADLIGDVKRDIVSWRPKAVGALIAGVVVATETIDTEYGLAFATVLDVNPEDTTVPLVRVAWLGVVLENAVARYSPARGDRVALRLLREGDKVKQVYANWRVIVDKPPDTPVEVTF